MYNLRITASTTPRLLVSHFMSMSSDIQSALAQQRLNYYTALVISVAIGYDYCLTFSKEVTFIWQRPWTRVSTLFLLIRYVGCLSAFSFVLSGSSFIPGPVTVRTCSIVSFLCDWSSVIFWAGAELAMTLRVYAIYNRSRIVLGGLLVMYIAEVVILIVSSSIYSDPKYATVTILPLPLNYIICLYTVSTQAWNKASAIAQFVYGSILCSLMVGKFARDLLRSYEGTRKWHLNRYITLVVREGILYFLATFFNSLVNMLGLLNAIPSGYPTIVLVIASTIPIYTLTPRFVMNIRELYMLDTQGHRNSDIDIGFGFSSRVGQGMGASTTIGTIAFAEGSTTMQLEDREEITEAESAKGSV